MTSKVVYPEYDDSVEEEEIFQSEDSQVFIFIMISDQTIPLFEEIFLSEHSQVLIFMTIMATNLIMRTNMMMFSWLLVTSDVGLTGLDICMTFSDILSYFLHMASICFALNRLEQDVGPTLQCIVGGQTGFLNKLLNLCGMPCNALDM